MLEIFDKLEKNVCRVFLDNKGNGTGFLISNKFILTDYHVIDKNKKIEVKFYNHDEKSKVNLLEIDEKYKELDIAVLELKNEIDFYQYIKVEARKLQRDERWLTRGYPSKKNDRAEEMRNDKHVIHQHLPKRDIEGFDIELNFDTTKWSSYRGLSGSPIIIDNSIVGIITSQQIDERSKELYGLSAKYFKDLIDELRRIEQSNNEIIDTITLENGTSFEIALVKVKLENGKTLYVGKYPVTFEEYDLFCEDTKRCKKYEPKDKGWGRGKRPVIKVSWDDAIAYCKWLNSYSNNKQQYSLLNSSDWLFVAEKNMPNLINADIWYNKKKKTSPVDIGGKGQLGIYHMYGNIYEWCIDGIEDDKYIALGGSYRTSNIKKFLRVEEKQTLTASTIGFRICSKVNL